MACILDDGDELLVPEPFYANYNTFTFMSGGVIHPIPTSADNGYRFADRKLIESQINERTRAILVTNPGNPTGLVLTHEEMRVIADVVKEHDLFLVADEVYREFIYDDEPMGTFCEMEDIKDHVIVVDSISKRFSACGSPHWFHHFPEPGIYGRGHEAVPGPSVHCHPRSDGRCRHVRACAAFLLQGGPGRVQEAAGRCGRGAEQDPRHQVPYAGRRLLHDGNAAGGRCGKASVFPAGGI